LGYTEETHLDTQPGLDGFSGMVDFLEFEAPRIFHG